MIAKRLIGHLPVNIAQAIAGFGAVAAFTRLLSPEDYGRYALVLVASQLIHTLTLTWAEAAAFRFHAKAKAEGSLAAHFAALNGLLVGAGVFAALLIAAAQTLFRADPALAAAASLAIGASFVRFITRVARETDRADHQVARYSIGETVFTLAGLALGIAFSATTTLGAGAPFLGLLIGALVIALPDALRLLRQGRGGKPKPAAVLAFAGYGMPLALALSLELAVQAGARFAIAAVLDETAVGAYAAAFGLARTIDLLFVWAGMAAAPLALSAFESGDRDKTLDLARGLVRTLYALTIPAAVGLTLVARPLAEAMVGPALANAAAALIPPLAVAGLFAGFSTYYFSEAFQLTRRTGLRAMVMLTPAALTVLLAGFGAHAFGLEGAAVAVAAAAACGTLFLALVGRRLLALPLALGDLARTLLAAAAMIPFVLAVPAWSGFAELLTKAMIGALAYAAAALLLNIAGCRPVTAAVWQRLCAKLRPSPG
jgi:O-antigen/teichoic acid export membrane protein